MLNTVLNDVIYTTGVWASVAAKAAFLSLFREVNEVEVIIPSGRKVKLPVLEAHKGYAEVKKLGRFCDDDITLGVKIVAEARLSDAGLIINGGRGVGIITKKGLKLPPGEIAINPVPRYFIIMNLKEAFLEVGFSEGVEVVISVPNGEEIARSTVNEKLGIVGGISILGTSGEVIPYSKKAFLDSIRIELEFAAANGLDTVVLCPGRETLAYANRIFRLPDEAFILIGDYIGFACSVVRKLGIKNIVFASQPAKLAKVALGFKNTNIRYGGVDIEKLKRLLSIECSHRYNTVREVFESIGSERWKIIEQMAKFNIERWSQAKVKVVTVSI